MLSCRSISQCAQSRPCRGYRSTALSTPGSYSGLKKSHLEVKLCPDRCLSSAETSDHIAWWAVKCQFVFSPRNEFRWRQSWAHPVGVWASPGESRWVQHYRNHIQAHSRWEREEEKKKDLFIANAIQFEVKLCHLRFLRLEFTGFFFFISVWNDHYYYYFFHHRSCEENHSCCGIDQCCYCW